MKIFFLALPAMILIFVSSCAKKYTCVCETLENRQGTIVRIDRTTTTMYGRNKEDVRADCEKNLDLGGRKTFECRLN